MSKGSGSTRSSSSSAPRGLSAPASSGGVLSGLMLRNTPVPHTTVGLL